MKKRQYNEAVYQFFIDLKKVYDSVRSKTLHNILKELGILMKLRRSIQMCLDEMYSKVRVGKICLAFFLLRMV
jgi:hypothetical protein